MEKRDRNTAPKVLMVELHSPGNRYVLELVRELKKECELTIFCDTRNTIDEPGIRWLRKFYNGGKGKAGALLAYGKTLVELEHEIRHGHYDVLHIQSYKFPATEIKLYLKLKKYYKKLAVTVHNILPHEPTEQDRQIFGDFYRQCDLLIVHNEATKRQLQEMFSLPEENIAVIPHGIYNTYEIRDNVRDEDPRRHFLFFGRIRPYKAVDLLLKAISLLDTETRGRCLFTIRGEQLQKKDATDYPALIREYGIGDCVVFSDERVPEEEIPSLMGNADVMITPYRRIYGSGVLLMAYTYGIPVIASDLPTFVEETDNGRTGLLFKNEDPEDLALTIRQAADWTPEQVAGYQREIQRLCREQYSWAVIAERTAEAFRETRSVKTGGAKGMDTQPIDDFLKTCADARYEDFWKNGHAAPGNNGPYGCTDTPVRNTAHWLITYTYLWKTTGDEKYRALALRFTEYLLERQQESKSGAIECVASGADDHLNGLIGQAWAIEALIYAYETFSDSRCLDCAVRIFHAQRFDSSTGFWKRVEPDGRELGFDETLNHQVWFAIGGLLILRHREDGEIRRQVEQHLKRVEKEYFGIHPSGLIRHFGAMKRPRRAFNKLYLKQYVKYAGLGLKIFKPQKVGILVQEEGYHLFELFGYAHIKRLLPDYPLFKHGDFEKALAYNRDTDTLNRRLGTACPETMNKYAYGYNSPAYEMPFIDLMFTGNVEEQKVLDLLALQKELCYNEQTKRMERNNFDPETLAARLYEYVCFCDCCREA